jgi:hypothetical protein
VRDPGLCQMRNSPFLTRLENDPRYTAFMKKMKLL